MPALDSARYVFVASMAAYVGLDPRKDLTVVMHPGPESMQLLAEGKIDAYLGFPPEPQEMRLKAADVCALEPEQAAQFIVDKAYAKRYDYALQVLKEIPFGQWREYSAEDTLRFYALRLHEVGMLKSSPQKLIAQGTDWRFLNELKKELKG